MKQKNLNKIERIFFGIFMVLITIVVVIAEEIPFVQLEDTSVTNVFNFFEFNETYADTLYYSITNPFGFFNLSDFNIADYLTKAEGDLLYASIGYGDEWNKTYADTLYTNSTDTNTNCSVAGTCTEIVYYNNASWIINNQNYNTTDDMFNAVDNGTFLKEETDPIFNAWDYSELLNKTSDTYINSTSDDWNNIDGNSLNFNESKLETSYYNVSSILVITGTPAGSLLDIQTYNNIPYNVSEVDSDLELRINFTGVINFNNLIVRYKSIEEDEPHILYVQIWDYEEEIWEDYDRLVAVGSYIIRNFGVYDSNQHIEDGIVQVRFYQDEGVPAKTHLHNFDWVALSKGYGVPSGQDSDTTYTAGDGLSLVGTIFSHNDSSSQADEDNLGRTYIQDIILDNYGHIISLVNATETFTDTNTHNTTDEIFNAVNNQTFYLLSNPYGFYNLSDFNIVDYVLSSVLLSYGYYNLSDFNIDDYSTKVEADNLYAPIGYGDEFNKTYADTLYCPINYNPFDQSLNITDNVEFNNITIDESIDWGNDIEEYANATCKIIRAGTTYFEVCK